MRSSKSKVPAGKSGRRLIFLKAITRDPDIMIQPKSRFVPESVFISCCSFASWEIHYQLYVVEINLFAEIDFEIVGAVCSGRFGDRKSGGQLQPSATATVGDSARRQFHSRRLLLRREQVAGQGMEAACLLSLLQLSFLCRLDGGTAAQCKLDASAQLLGNAFLQLHFSKLFC